MGSDRDGLFVLPSVAQNMCCPTRILLLFGGARDQCLFVNGRERLLLKDDIAVMTDDALRAALDWLLAERARIAVVELNGAVVIGAYGWVVV